MLSVVLRPVTVGLVRMAFQRILLQGDTNYMVESPCLLKAVGAHVVKP